MFGTSKQTWWKPSPLLGQEARDAGRVVGRLDELDLRLPHPEEGDPDPVVRDVHDGLELEAERVAPQAERVLDRADDESDVVDLAETADGLGHRGIGVGRHGRSVPCRPCLTVSPRARSSSACRSRPRSSGSAAVGTGPPSRVCLPT